MQKNKEFLLRIPNLNSFYSFFPQIGFILLNVQLHDFNFCCKYKHRAVELITSSYGSWDTPDAVVWKGDFWPALS